MKISLARAIITLGLLGITTAAFAEATGNDDRQASFVLSGGLTYGGDSLEKVYYTNGDSINIRAGSGVQIGAGALIKAADLPLDFELTANYQYDGASAKNGTASFTRIPLEAKAFYTGINKWRFGAGLRYTLSPKLSGLESVNGADYNFKNAFGEILEVGYSPAPHLWISANYTFESFKFKDNLVDVFGNTYAAPTVKADHFGLFTSYAF